MDIKILIWSEKNVLLDVGFILCKHLLGDLSLN